MPSPESEAVLRLNSELCDAWLADPRDAYADYLMTRLEAPRPFVEEVERARTAA